MRKAVRISLPNGRNWLRTRDAVDHFKTMLARCLDGARVADPTDHSDLASLLQVYDSVRDAGEPTKTEAGVSHFERRKRRNHLGNTSCFFVVRADGTSIDFSIRRAIDVAGAKAN